MMILIRPNNAAGGTLTGVVTNADGSHVDIAVEVADTDYIAGSLVSSWPTGAHEVDVDPAAYLVGAS